MKTPMKIEWAIKSIRVVFARLNGREKGEVCSIGVSFIMVLFSLLHFPSVFVQHEDW